jgi:hypothetical protein
MRWFIGRLIEWQSDRCVELTFNQPFWRYGEAAIGSERMAAIAIRSATFYLISSSALRVWPISPRSLQRYLDSHRKLALLEVPYRESFSISLLHLPYTARITQAFCFTFLSIIMLYADFSGAKYFTTIDMKSVDYIYAASVVAY